MSTQELLEKCQLHLQRRWIVDPSFCQNVSPWNSLLEQTVSLLHIEQGKVLPSFSNHNGYHSDQVGVKSYQITYQNKAICIPWCQTFLLEEACGELYRFFNHAANDRLSFDLMLRGLTWIHFWIILRRGRSFLSLFSRSSTTAFVSSFSSLNNFFHHIYVLLITLGTLRYGWIWVIVSVFRHLKTIKKNFNCLLKKFAN